MDTVCFIDLDGTIMVNPFATAVWPVITRELAASTGLSPKVFLREFEAENLRRQHAQPNDPLTMDWDDIVHTIARKHGVKLSVRVIDLVRDHCKEPHIAILDSADIALKALKTQKRRLVVASKGLSKYQMPVLAALALQSLFDDFLMPDLTGYLKTEAGFYESYTRACDDCLFIHIGDHYYDDVICPKRLGFKVILRLPLRELDPLSPFERPQKLNHFRHRIATYPPEPTSVTPDAIITHLNELPNVVSELEKRHRPN